MSCSELVSHIHTFISVFNALKKLSESDDDGPKRKASFESVYGSDYGE